MCRRKEGQRKTEIKVVGSDWKLYKKGAGGSVRVADGLAEVKVVDQL